MQLNLYVTALYIVVTLYITDTLYCKVAMVHPSYKRGEQGWYNGESAHFPPMRPSGFKSWRQCYMWVEFVLRGFLELLPHVHEGGGNMHSLSSSKINTSKFQFDLECIDIFKRVLKKSEVLHGKSNYRLNCTLQRKLSTFIEYVYG